MTDAVIYPPTITTDQEKLFACYSLLEQMRLEHNSKAADFRSRLALEAIPTEWLIGGKLDDKNEQVKQAKAKRLFREWCPEGFMLADTPENNELRQKYKTYAKQSKDLMKGLLAEKDKLKKSIREANYTDQEWRLIFKLPEQEQDTIYDNLFGNRTEEGVKPTLATSHLLDKLKALSIDGMALTPEIDPTEDLTTYIEYDQGSDISVSSNRVTHSNSDPYDDNYWVYKNFGTGHFDGNFEHLYQWKLTSAFYPTLIAWAMCDVNPYAYTDMDDDQNIMITRVSYSSMRVRIFEMDDTGTGTVDQVLSAWSVNTQYYAEVERDEAVGTYGTLYWWHCHTDYYDDGGDLDAALDILISVKKKDYSHLCAALNWDDNGGGIYSNNGYSELYDLQEGGGGGWAGKISGVTNPAKVAGVDAANIAKVKGVA